MRLIDLKKNYGEKAFSMLENTNIDKLRPSQEKSIQSGLLKGKNVLVCTPTASGKTFVAEIAMIKKIVDENKKAIYVVPLKALASEKFKEFSKKYPGLKVALSIGDTDSSESYLSSYDIIVTTAEKMDSLVRHKADWIGRIGLVIIDEIHLLNDISRGPTLEILITMLKMMLRDVQFVCLSATIGNSKELAEWLNAELIVDDWRPVKLEKGVYFNDEIEFFS